MNKSRVSYLTISDIHLGHTRITTAYIVANLHLYIATNHNLFKKLDIIFLAGDVYDKLLTTNSKEYALANQWLAALAMYCRKYNIKLRILEGTPSHDWKQIDLFSKTIEALGIDIDYKYHDTLTIERMDDLGVDILYIPDEWNHDASDTLLEVKKLLVDRGLDKVDIGIFHGQFAHQLPMVELPSSHDAKEYLSLVKYYINIGHIHISSVYDRILAQGSFDRLSHNEEGPKGGMVMNLYSSGSMDFVFIKNTNAYPHKKFDIHLMSTEEAIRYLNKKLPKLKVATRVKIVVANNEVTALLKPLQQKYKDLIFTIDKKKVVKDKIIKNNRIVIEPFEITKSNITELISKGLCANGLPTEDMALANEELSAVLETIN